MFLSYSCFKNCKAYQFDLKYVFLTIDLNEELYTKQLEGFKFPSKEEYVWRVKKALYGLKQAPSAWYDPLDKYLTH